MGGAVAPAPAVRPALYDWVESMCWVAAATLIGLVVRRFLDVRDIAMLQLLAVVIAATRVRAAPSLLAAVASVIAFDLFFVPPLGTFAVDEPGYVLTFAVMLGVGIIVSRLTIQVRDQADAALDRERRTAALYAMSRDFAQETDPVVIARLAVAHVRDHLHRSAIVWAREAGEPVLLAQTSDSVTDPHDVAAVRWVLERGRESSAAMLTPSAIGPLHLPLVGASGPIGVLSVGPTAKGAPLGADQRLLVEAFCRQTALALERALLSVEAQRARVAAETERLKNELLSAVSHDLRTPLASITGSATAMLADDRLGEAARRELLETIREEGEHLGRLVADLLDLTRIESGAVRARQEWYPVEEVVHSALGRADLRGRHVRVDVPDEVLVAPMDPTLIGQVLVNLLENAARFGDPGSAIDLVARVEGVWLRIEVLDRGPGVPQGEEERIFEKFYRAADGQRAAGTGLGLAICRAIVRAHDGRIRAVPREGGGARFVVELPYGEPPPPPVPE